MSVSVKISKITFPVALLALAAWMEYLGVIHNDEGAKGWVIYLVVAAVILHIIPPEKWL